ncbi:MAG TPA: PilZ domain-containing protein [Solimonas sp.]|jgi:type IV pilus assembly protein PilZ|nr:PilZ domain-containing protein [Solimonas sp.]
MSTQPPRTGGAPPGILTLHIKDKSALYVAYMPFVKNGGLFIPTNKDYRLGDDIFMLLTLMDNPERLPVAGKVIWVTPKGAQNKRVQGVGVQFSAQDAGATQKKIEGLLAGALGADRPTHTM